MKNFNEYVHFVVGAKIAGCEIETLTLNGSRWDLLSLPPAWQWDNFPRYRIQLPEGWEYVIEDGDIAFREVKDHEYYCDSGGHPRSKKSYWTSKKYPIIKRKDNK